MRRQRCDLRRPQQHRDEERALERPHRILTLNEQLKKSQHDGHDGHLRVGLLESTQLFVQRRQQHREGGDDRQARSCRPGKTGTGRPTAAVETAYTADV